jgi:hypothetical protein
MMLFNPTNEDFGDMMFGGRGYPLKAGEKIKVDDACGRHLINAYSVRGLCSLEYGDEEGAIAEAGIKRNLEFKKRLINQHNQSNISRRQQGLPYRPPTAQLRKYSEEMNIVLEEPYTPQKIVGADGDRMALLEQTVANLSNMMTLFMSKMMVEETEVAAPAKSGGGKKEKDK